MEEKHIVRDFNSEAGYITSYVKTIEATNNEATLNNVHYYLGNCRILKVKKLDERAVIPESFKGGAGLDLYVYDESGKDIVIPAGGFHKFHTGLAIETPQGMHAEIYVRSSVGCKKHLRLMNSVGIVDESYRGEILVFIHNFGQNAIEVKYKERLCQMLLKESYNVHVVEVDELSDTERGSNGFGSTGK